jgi:hypothetical protein
VRTPAACRPEQALRRLLEFRSTPASRRGEPP